MKSTNPGAWAVVVMAYLCLLTFRILGSIVILGKACDLIDEHKTKQEAERKETAVSPAKTAKSAAPSAVVRHVVTEASNDNDSLFESDHPTEDVSKQVFLFQTASEDREDVVLATMNSTMLGDGMEDLGQADPGLAAGDSGQDTFTPNRLIEVINSSLLGPAVEASPNIDTGTIKKPPPPAEEDAAGVGGLLRSHSSPDLVTDMEGSGDDWADTVDTGSAVHNNNVGAGAAETED